MNYSEAIKYIHSVDWKGSRPGLSRINELMEGLGHPEDSFKSIHVAGTNGKGSFCAMLDSVLSEAGYKTGLFTSPYIEFFEERIRYCGENISEEDLSDAVSEVKAVADKMEDVPTEFEILTAVGFCYFRKKKVDIAIIECGMGGRLDSTNVIKAPVLSVITGISLDHVAFLGDTVEKIASEKAGIIKQGTPVLYGGNDEKAEKVISEKAAELGCTFVKTDRSLIRDVKTSKKGNVFSYGKYKNVKLSLSGSYQPENASNVINAVELLRKRGYNISDKALYSGLKDTAWKGRFEKLNDCPEIYFDGGHNEEGVCAAVDTVKKCFGDKKINIISGVLADKDYEKIAKEISGVAEKVYTVTPDSPRALDSKKYAEVFKKLGINAVPCDSFDTAVNKIITEKGKIKPTLCVGSLYSYPDFKKSIKENKENVKVLRRLNEKRLVKKLFAALPCIIAVLLALNIFINSSLFDSLFGQKIKYREYPPLDFVYEPDFTLDVFEDEMYLEKQRGLTYVKDGVALYLERDDEIALAGDLAVFFNKYFETVVYGQTDAHNALYTDYYKEKKGEYEPFTMQMIYESTVTYLEDYPHEKLNGVRVYKFDVGYKIMNNNGTFRNNLHSDTRRDMLYTLYRYSNGDILVNYTSEYLEIID